METTLIPEQTLSAHPNYENENIEGLSRICHVEAEVNNVRNFLSGQQSLGSQRKRPCVTPRKTPLSFAVSVKRTGDNVTMECCLSMSFRTHHVFNALWQNLPKHGTAKLCLALMSPEMDSELVRFQNKAMEFRQNKLWFTETIEGFDFTTWNDIDNPVFVTISVNLGRKEQPVEVKGDKQHTITMCNKILQNMDYADAKIKASNGVEFPCHKVFLSAQSPFFHRMFTSGMRESVSGCVTLDDFSENVVRAMLNFIYCGNLPDATINCETALELLIAGDQYEIAGLENAIRNFMYTQTSEWFSTSVAVELWQFSNKKTKNENNASYKCLEEKAVQVLRSKPEAEIRECPAVSKMLENPQAGILDFCMYLLKNDGARSSGAATLDENGITDERGQRNANLRSFYNQPSPTRADNESDAPTEPVRISIDALTWGWY